MICLLPVIFCCQLQGGWLIITLKIRQIVVLYNRGQSPMSMRERALRQIKNIQSCGCRLPAANGQEGELFLGGYNFKAGMDGHQHLPKRVSAMAKPRKSLKVHRQGKENGQVIRTCFTPKDKGEEVKSINTYQVKMKAIPSNANYHRNSMKFDFNIEQNCINGPVFGVKTRPVFPNKVQSDNPNSKTGQKYVINRADEQKGTIYTARNQYRRLDKDNGQCRLNKIQSSQNLLIPQFSSFKNSDSNRVSYFSQFAQEIEGSSSKVTHKLSDLNFKCTESVKDTSSPAISEIVSDSDSSFSEKPTEDAPVRFKDLKMRKAKIGQVRNNN